MNQRVTNIVLVAAMAAMMLLFCATTLFNTKGEPREAIVALSMLQSGDWILPSSFGGEEMPYKPPFLAWCIALASLLFGGGHVTELTSRLPSLVAAMCMVVATARFFTRHGRHGQLAGVMAAWVTITSFEVFRAATACRVDMVLTAFMVCALYSLYDWWAMPRSQRRGGLPWGAVLLMSGAFLTKGPVGVFLPCLAIGIYRLTRSDRFWPLFLRLVAVGLCSLVIPAVWYVLAGMRGGDRFIDLIVEENVGRMTGTMSYASHENPAWYNVLTLLTGMVPYTLLALMSLAVVRWRGLWPRLKEWVRSRMPMTEASAFALVSALTIFIFFCIPKSKRSVYLLPMYPFVAWGVTMLMLRLGASRPGRIVARWFGGIMGVLAIILPLAWVALKFGAGDSVRDTAHFNEYQSVGMTVVSALFAVVSLGVGLMVLRTVRTRLFAADYSGLKCFVPTAVALFAVYSMLDNAILPPILSQKTDRVVAEQINALQPEGTVWSWVNEPMLRFYTANFYLDDRLRQIPSEGPYTLPAPGSLMIVGEIDLERLASHTPLSYEVVWKGERRSCDVKQKPLIIRLK